uniref:V-type proton ATPase subunit G n=1 Tax=Nomascus leucogenys TaxID=61853 RepID=A0A2I3GLM3_NOMLE
KNRRLKQAKAAAQAEIEQYRRQREKEFKAKEAAALGSRGSCVEKETQEKRTILQTYFRQNRDEVFDNLLAFVCDIQPEIHENYCING